MGLMDLAGSLLGGGDAKSQLAQAAMNLIGNQSEGGLAGLVKSFGEKGLGDVVSSWVGTGQNLPISADQITQALGADKISEIAGKLGVSKEDAASSLAGALPDVVDKLTPEGKIPDNDMLQQGLSMLKSKLFGS
ncbi:MAG TPA: YidB family protein [Dissulfurispiraceae bacterium]|nr:YidB family protein [Dissulfurispiraceae bacterium]